MADDAGFTYENDAIIGAGEPVGGYDVTVDMTSTESVNNTLLRMQGGQDGAVSNIAVSSASDRRLRARREAERLSNTLLTDALRTALQKELRQVNAIIAQLDTLIDQIQQQMGEVRVRIDQIKNEILPRIDGELDSLEMDLAGARGNFMEGLEMLNPAAKERLTEMIETARPLITVKAYLSEEEAEAGGIARRHVVFRDEATNEYYIQDPETGARINVEDLVEAPSQDPNARYTIAQDIEYQLSGFSGEYSKVFGNDIDPSVIDRYNRQYDAYLEALPEGPIRAGIVNFYDNIRYIEIRKHTLQLERDQIEQELEALEQEYARLEEQLEATEAERTAFIERKAELEAQLQQYESDIAATSAFARATSAQTNETYEILRELNDQYIELTIDGVLSETDKQALFAIDVENNGRWANLIIEMHAANERITEISEEREAVQAVIEIIDNGMEDYTSRHAQLLEIHGSTFMKIADGAVGALNFVTGLVGVEPMRLVTKERMLDFAEDNPNHQLTQAWRDVVKHDGKVVFRSNETGDLYTINQETGQQEIITDIEVINRLRTEIHVNGRFTGNESPFYHSEYDTFDETSEAILTAAEMKETYERQDRELEDEQTGLQRQVDTIRETVESGMQGALRDAGPSMERVAGLLPAADATAANSFSARFSNGINAFTSGFDVAFNMGSEFRSQVVPDTETPDLSNSEAGNDTRTVTHTLDDGMGLNGNS